MSQSQSEDAEFERLTEPARSVLRGHVSPELDEAGRERLLQRLAASKGSTDGSRQKRARIVRRAWIAAAAVVVVAAALVTLSVSLFREPALTFAVEGGRVMRSEAGTAFISQSDSPTTARFSDGSVVAFSSGASGRIDEVGSRGARVILTQGVVHMSIVHREKTAWSLEAGPYVVHVTGTEFEVRWDPSTSALAIEMIDGSVRVEGPSAPKGINVEGGYRLSTRDDGPLTLARSDAPVPSALPSSHAPSADMSAHPLAPMSASSVAAVVTPNAASAKATSSSWTALVSAGKYADVLAAARARGIASVAESAPLADLVAVADAARYERDGATARSMLEAQRKRFGATPAGRAATFLLGRLADDSGEGSSKAIALYDEYLAAGGGPYSHEALGRKMVAVRKSQGDAAAKPIAASYLTTYPEGAYAAVARAIVGSP